MTRWSAIPLLMAVAIALSILPIAHAADINLSDTCTLADAIKAANTDAAVGDCPAGDGADTINLSGYIGLAAALPPITTEMTIEGGGFTISGRDRFRIFVVNAGTLTVNELTMTKGNADWGGAIVNFNGGALTINDSTISHSKAPEGGAIGNEGAVTISNSALRGNSADEGGAIHSIGGTVTLRESRIILNTVQEDGDGGGVYIEVGYLTITDSTFSDNSSDDAGGAVYMVTGTLTIRNSSFLRNISSSSGGAIYNNEAVMRIEGSQFKSNAAKSGGALLNSDSTDVRITTCLFESNSARRSAGAIGSDWGSTTIIKSTFYGNSAGENGGAIASNWGVDIVGSTFIGNSAGDRGGAITGSRSIDIESSMISSNVAKNEGGGLYLSDPAAFAWDNSVTHTTLVNNAAASGGGVYTEGGKSGLFNTIIANNEGGDCFGRLADNIGNLIADGSCFATLTGDPMLGELVEPEDLSPPYYPLLEGSPAIGAADREYCPATDILGTRRPQGARCDIGAYEWVPADN